MHEIDYMKAFDYVEITPKYRGNIPYMDPCCVYENDSQKAFDHVVIPQRYREKICNMDPH